MIRGHHVHAVRLPRARDRGQEALRPRVRRAHRRARGPGRSRDLRQGGRGHDPGERDHLLLLPGGRLLPRGRAHHPELARSATPARKASTSSARPTSCWRRTSSGGTTSSSSPATTRPRSRSSTSRAASPAATTWSIDQPYSNGIWYDVGNVDGVFVNNWIEGAHRRLLLRDLQGGDRGRQRVRRLRQGHPRAQLPRTSRVYNNTFVDTRRLLRAQRAQRGRRPLRLAPAPPAPTSTSARATSSWATCWWRASRYRKPLLRFEQPKALCERLTRPQVKRARRQRLRARGERRRRPLVVWSPVAGETCQVELGSLEDLRKLQPAFEARGRYLDATTSARSSGARSCAATSSRGSCRGCRRPTTCPPTSAPPRLARAGAARRPAPSPSRAPRRAARREAEGPIPLRDRRPRRT